MYYTESILQSRQWIKMVVSILLLCVYLTHTAALSSCSYGYSEDKESSNKIILIHNSGIPLEIICTLRSVYSETEKLYFGYAEPKPEPYTRIAFFNFTKRIDSKYVSRMSSMTAKLEIPNPPLYVGKIFCVLLMDNYEKSLNYKNPYEISTIKPWYMPQIYPGLGVFICTNDLFIISLENENLKINVVGINDTTIDIQLKLPRVVFSNPSFIVNYYRQFEANSHIVMNKTRFQLENLATNQTYYISVKLCSIIHIKQFCTNFTNPIEVKTGYNVLAKDYRSINNKWQMSKVINCINTNMYIELDDETIWKRHIAFSTLSHKHTN